MDGLDEPERVRARLRRGSPPCHLIGQVHFD